MKKVFRSLLFLLLTGSLWAQNLSESKNALIDYEFILSGEIIDVLDSYSPRTDREKETAKRVKKERERYFMDQLYTFIGEQLQTIKQIELLPKGTLSDKMVYCPTGYPCPLIPKQVIKKKMNDSQIDHFVQYKVSFSKPLVGGLLGVKPNCEFEIVVFDAKGSKVKTFVGKAKPSKSIKPFDFRQKKFDKMNGDQTEELYDLFFPIAQEAINNAISSI